MNEVKLFSGEATRYLSEKIADYHGQELGSVSVNRFSDGEIHPVINELVRGSYTFFIQSTFAPTDNLMELLLMIDAAKRASAGYITAVIPYYGYARQDRKDKPRVPISAKLVASLLEAAGVDRIMTMDFHADQIQGFFNIPVDHLYAAPILLKYIRDKFENVVLVSPDAGGVERTRAFAKRLDASLAIVDKRRETANVCEALHVIGDVAGKTAIMLDDMVDTAGTLCGGAEILKAKGAKEVHACCSHALLSGPAIDRINASSLKSLLVTNSIPLRQEAQACEKITVLSVGALLGEAIKRIHNEDSVSYLFV